MIAERFLRRDQWEKKLREIGAAPVAGLTSLNYAEWWKIAGQPPFTVPLEDETGKSDFWAIQKLCQQLNGPRLFKADLNDGD